MKRILKEIRDFKIVSKRDNLLDNFSLFDNPSYVTNIPSDVNILKQEDIFNLEFSSNENSTLNNNTILNLLNEKMSEENKQYMINENYKNPTSYLNNNSDLKFVEENPYINESFQEEREEIKKKLQFILKTSDMINLNENVMSRVKTNSINLKNVDRVFVQMEFIDKDDLKDTTGEAIHQFSDNVKKLEEKFQNRIDLIKRQMNYYQQRIDQLSYELDGLIMNKLSIHINQLYALKQENYSEEKEEIKIDLNNRKVLFIIIINSKSIIRYS